MDSTTLIVITTTATVNITAVVENEQNEIQREDKRRSKPEDQVIHKGKKLDSDKPADTNELLLNNSSLPNEYTRDGYTPKYILGMKKIIVFPIT